MGAAIAARLAPCIKDAWKTERSQMMKPKIQLQLTGRRSAGLGLAMLGGMGMLALTSLLFAGGGSNPGIKIEPLTRERTTLTDDVSIAVRLQPGDRPEQVIEFEDPSHIAVFRFTVPPGEIFPWHTHPGLALSGVQQGQLVYVYADDCIERPYPAGTMFVDPGGDNVHTAYNPSESEETVVVVTFLNAPADGGLTLPVDEAQGARLDERCGIDR